MSSQQKKDPIFNQYEDLVSVPTHPHFMATQRNRTGSSTDMKISHGSADVTGNSLTGGPVRLASPPVKIDETEGADRKNIFLKREAPRESFFFKKNRASGFSEVIGRVANYSVDFCQPCLTGALTAGNSTLSC